MPHDVEVPESSVPREAREEGDGHADTHHANRHLHQLEPVVVGGHASLRLAGREQGTCQEVDLHRSESQRARRHQPRDTSDAGVIDGEGEVVTLPDAGHLRQLDEEVGQ